MHRCLIERVGFHIHLFLNAVYHASVQTFVLSHCIGVWGFKQAAGGKGLSVTVLS